MLLSCNTISKRKKERKKEKERERERKKSAIFLGRLVIQHRFVYSTGPLFFKILLRDSLLRCSATDECRGMSGGGDDSARSSLKFNLSSRWTICLESRRCFWICRSLLVIAELNQSESP